jgi:hypothetical protein
MKFDRYSCKVISWLPAFICWIHLFKLLYGFVIMQCKILYFAKGFGDFPKNLENKKERGAQREVAPSTQSFVFLSLNINIYQVLPRVVGW